MVGLFFKIPVDFQFENKKVEYNLFDLNWLILLSAELNRLIPEVLVGTFSTCSRISRIPKNIKYC